MEITRQLYQLQELDIEIEQAEQSLALKTGRLGNREALEAARGKLASAQKRLDELKHQRHDAEWQVDDILSKIKATEQQLYGGKVTNPKELSNLQHEINTLKSRSDELQDKALGIIELVEAGEKDVAAVSSDYKIAEEEWHRQQKQLAGEIEQLKARLAELKQERGQLAGQIDAPVIALYEKIRQQKKLAVAKVEQGICRACRISLSVSALQKARGGQPVQCGTCGRILFIS
jgi:predicted  nucleic acid-binding Zn-ribbon protein